MSTSFCLHRCDQMHFKVIFRTQEDKGDQSFRQLGGSYLVWPLFIFIFLWPGELNYRNKSTRMFGAKTPWGSPWAGRAISARGLTYSRPRVRKKMWYRVHTENLTCTSSLYTVRLNIVTYCTFHVTENMPFILYLSTVSRQSVSTCVVRIKTCGSLGQS